jgi:hypothetical protein
MNDAMDILIPSRLCEIKLRESTSLPGLITQRRDVANQCSYGMLTQTASISVQKGLDSSVDPVKEVVVQVACPVSHFAVAGYFGENQQSFKRRSANLAAL